MQDIELLPLNEGYGREAVVSVWRREESGSGGKWSKSDDGPVTRGGGRAQRVADAYTERDSVSDGGGGSSGSGYCAVSRT